MGAETAECERKRALRVLHVASLALYVSAGSCRSGAGRSSSVDEAPCLYSGWGNTGVCAMLLPFLGKNSPSTLIGIDKKTSHVFNIEVFLTWQQARFIKCAD